MHKLITIRVSHYNEKARWVLERFGVGYREEGYMPGLHAVGVLRVAPKFGFGKSDRVSTPLATPILVTAEGECVRDSSRIARYVSDRYAKAGQELYPTPEVEELEQRFSTKLGPHTRRFVYFHAFQDPSILARMAEENVSARQARWFRRVYPLVASFIGQRLQVTEEKAARSLEAIFKDVEEISRRVENRRYLVGDRFSAADMTFAAMLAPVFSPSPEEGYGAVLPPLEGAPDAYRRVAKDIRASPAGQFALRMFREERKPRPTS